MKNHPALVLNADYQPISYFPLSLWSWQDTIKAVFLDRVNIIAEYETEVRSSSFSMKIPSVIALKNYIPICHYSDKCIAGATSSFSDDYSSYLIVYSRFGLITKYKWACNLIGGTKTCSKGKWIEQ